ncbi:MAG: UDP-N-acetylmuramoyl-L-alanine--D-glutamate ligase [Acidiferrobacterales bacterium]|nr:UDP-N-acetylmuramoyl-L-alanine--D-glutamate ligase [Acidiferrobacterales bacterium]
MQATQNTIGNSVPSAVVVGLGKNSISCAAYLIDEGWDVEMLDVKPHPQLERLAESELPGIMIHSEVDPYAFMNANMVVTTRVMTGQYSQVAQIASEYGCRTVTSLELFFERSTKPVVAIVGSNGKSTVLALVDAIANRQGRATCIDAKYGYPFLDLLDADQPDVYVMELSAQQLAQVHSISPDIITILNHSADNGAVTSIDTVKRVARNADLRIVNRDDPAFSSADLKGARIEFGRSGPKSESDYGILTEGKSRWVVKGTEKLIRTNHCALQGSHNELNIVAACALAETIGYAPSVARNAIKNFKALPYSCEDEGRRNGIRWVNDARSTNVDSTIAAIEHSKGNVVLIAGGLSQGDDFAKVARKVNGKLTGCVLFGCDGWKLNQSFDSVKNKELVESIDDAIVAAEQIASEGDCVVFSPGCVSHDMFSDYQQRGETFSKALQTHFDGNNTDTI